MITSSDYIKINYEDQRLSRYANIQQNVFYTHSEYLAAYEAWTTSYSGARWPEWDDYCDVRDKVPRGTNAKFRQERGSREAMTH